MEDKFLGQGMLFIISQPRSGSTLLQAIVSNNSKINTVSEPWLFFAFTGLIRPDLVYAMYDQNLATDAVENFITKVHGVKLDIWIRSKINELYTPLFLPDYKYILDKTPRYYEILPDIQKILPEAKIIILKRNPIDVLKSIINTWGYKNIVSLLRHKRDLLNAPFLIQEFILKNKFNDKVKEVRYEDIVSNTEKTIKDIYNWLDVEYIPEVLNIQKNKKFLGKFGDPGLNKEARDIGVRKTTNGLNKKFRRFVSGYAHYLTPDFLEEYGAYKFKDAKKTRVFDFYLEAESLEKFTSRYGLRKEFKFRFFK